MFKVVKALQVILRRVSKISMFPMPFVDYRPRRNSLARRGTEYGGWWFDPESLTAGCCVVSAGAGEDISFDVAIASEFDVEVIIIDPTPRAIAHVEATLSRIGEPGTDDFIPGGKQDPRAYDLTGVSEGQISLLPFALWNADTELSFHPPLNPEHVSHSVDNWRRGDGDFTPPPLRVPARRLTSLLPDGRLATIKILKIDIEGAEIEVIVDILDAGVRPAQILVEFDQLSRPSRWHRARARKSFRALREAGYALAKRDRLNFSFMLSE